LEEDAKEQSEERPSVGREKTEITAWLEAHKQEIVSGELVVFFLEECCWGRHLWVYLG